MTSGHTLAKARSLLEQIGMIMPLRPEQLLFDQASVQEQFLPGTEARSIQDSMDARGWAYRFVCRVGDTDLIIIERQYDDFGLAIVSWPKCSS